MIYSENVLNRVLNRYISGMDLTKLILLLFTMVTLLSTNQNATYCILVAWLSRAKTVSVTMFTFDHSLSLHV